MEAPDIFSYFPHLSEAQKAQFTALKPLYSEWNEKINVISRKDMDNFYERHVLHSLAIAKFVDFVPGTTVFDIGTGGGFPGVPLAIMFPEVRFTLVDSIGKKIKVGTEVAQAIGLTNITFHHERVEKIPGKFDFVVSRAVADISELFSWCHNKVNFAPKNTQSNGMICLKGGELSSELDMFKKPHQIVELHPYFPTEYFETKKLVYVPLGR